MFSYNEILNRMLSKIPNTLDKREGSIIFDALAPAAAELAQAYIDLEIYMEQTYLLTATGINLDNRGADYGIERDKASYSIRLGEMKNNDGEYISVPIGSRFSTPETNVTYEAIEEIELGKYKLKCEQEGTIGDDYSGNLLSIYYIEKLATATISTILTPGQNDEDDETYRTRIIDRINQKPFAGNKSAYLEIMNDIEGVGAAKIFPIWNGGGTVKISFVDSDFNQPSTEFINQVQTIIDPIPNNGEGLGLAPIGHTVTVVAPDFVDINISANVDLEANMTAQQVQEPIQEAIEKYIKEIQTQWTDAENDLILYKSRIIAQILTVKGVNNVSSLLINLVDSDLHLPQTATTQNFPKLNEVIINEN